MTAGPSVDDREVRARLARARDRVRHERAEVMLKIGVSLRGWRERDEVLQQDLADDGCVSATVVRRIEKGDYESPPPQSLISAVSRRGGPAGLLEDLGRAYQQLQAQQKQIDKLLNRRVLPATATRLADQDETVRAGAGLRPAQLPLPPALFVGRNQELAALDRLIEQHRLVTIVGPGGIGKTALCLRFAQAWPRSSSGPWFADFSTVRSGESLSALLDRLILDEDEESGHDGAFRRLSLMLKDRRALIVLDNCEHILPAAAQSATELLNACSGVHLVATSREPLHLPDETVLTIGPLPVAPATPPATGPASDQGEAVELFVRLLGKARGTEARLSPSEAEAAENLCRQLDGVPLSIELAAARARTLSVSDIAVSAGRSLSILSGGRQDIPRHQAIEATIRWSWDLLGPADRDALSRLTIMSAPFSFQCGAYVAADLTEDGDQAVASLADKSLLSPVTDETGGRRLKLLGVVQSFAATQLSPIDRTYATRRLMAWALRATQIDELELQHTDTIEQLDRDLPLIRDALDVSSDSPGDQVRLALAIWQYWETRSLNAYGCQFLAKAYDHHIALSPAERGRALGALANLLFAQGKYTESIAAAERGIEIRRAVGDPTQMRYGLLNLSSMLLRVRRFEEADKYLAESAQLPGVTSAGYIGDLRLRQGRERLRKGDVGGAVQLIQEATKRYAQAELAFAQGSALAHLSVAQRHAGNVDEALRSAQQAWQVAGTKFAAGLDAYIAVSMAEAYLALGRHEDALDTLESTHFDDRTLSAIRAHGLAVRVMAASVRRPIAAASLLAEHLSEFTPDSDFPDASTMTLVRAVSEIAYHAGHYKSAARMLGAHAGLWPVEQDFEIGPPEPAKAARLQCRLTQSEMQLHYDSGRRMSAADAFHAATTVLTSITS